MPHRKLLAASTGLIVLLVLAELGARAWLAWFADDAAFLRYASIAEVQASRRFPSLILRHSYLGYALQPGYEHGPNRINSLGYRGAEFPRAKPAGEFRIVCLGASTTFGGGLVDWREAYPARLQDELHARDLEHARVVNAGVSGYTSWETLASYLFRASDLEPDLLIVYHAANDLVARLTWPPETYRSDNSALRSPASQVHWPALYEHSDALRMLAIEAGLVLPHSRLDRLFGGRSEWHIGAREFDDDELRRVLAANPPRYFERNLARLARAAHDDGTQVLFLTFARCSGFTDQRESTSPAFAEAFAEMNASLRAVAAATQSPLYDLAADYPDDRALFLDAVHMNAQGCARMAHLIAEALERLALLGS